MFEHTPHAALIVFAHQLVYRHKDGKVVSAVIPEAAFNHLEILDRALFTKTIEDLLAQLSPLPSEVLVLLSDEVTFFKEVESSQMSEEVEQQFKNALPFPSTEITITTIDTKGYIAADLRLIKCIRQALETHNVDVSQVLPTLAGNISDSELSTADWSTVLFPTEVREKTNFLISKQVEKQSTDQTILSAAHHVSKLIYCLLLLLILVGGVAIAVLWLQMRSTQQEMLIQPEPVVVHSEFTPAPEVTIPPAIEVESNKVNVKIVLIASVSEARTAEVLRDTFRGLSYGDVSIQATDSAAPLQTTVEFMAPLSEEMRSEIVSRLSETFETIQVQESSQSLTTEVVITLGQEMTAGE